MEKGLILVHIDIYGTTQTYNAIPFPDSMLMLWNVYAAQKGEKRLTRFGAKTQRLGYMR